MVSTDTTPATERTVILAQIALEGVTLSEEVQAASNTGTLRAILATAVYRSSKGMEPLRYAVGRPSPTETAVYPVHSSLP